MSDDEVMRFEITDHDLDNEFNFDLRRPKISKNRATYGIWAEDSDNEEDADARPSFGGPSRRPGNADYTAPVGFVSAGFKKTAKEEAEEMANQKAGSDKEEGDDDTFSAGLGLKPKKKRVKKLQPERVGEQIAGLRKTGYSQPVNLGKGLGDWEKHTKGIGAKLLLKMGYEAGKGLGKELQGRSSIVEAHLRKGRGAIGAYGKEGSRPKVQEKDSEEEEEEEFLDKLHQWKKGGKDAKQKKIKYVYRTADQILEDGKWRQISDSSGGEAAKVKIIDMTGKEKRVLSSFHAMSAQKIRPDEEEVLEDNDAVVKKKVVFDLPELRHNIDLLLDQCEEELISTDRTLKHHKNRLDVLKEEEEKLSVLLDKEKSELTTLDALLDNVEKLETLHERGDLDLESARDLLSSLEAKYPEEYRGLELPYIAVTIVVPPLKSQLRSWNCLSNPHLNVDEFLQWRDILCLSGKVASEKQSEPMDPYHSLLWECWMPVVRQAITGWNAKNPDCLIKFLDIWSNLIPRWMKNNICEHVLLPKLQAAVELWDPRSDPVPIHSWLHPWLPMLGEQLEIVYPTIRNKLSSALTAWHPSDRSAKLILLPWRDIFSKASMHSFILKSILPKLEQTLAMELIINPVQQNLDPWHWIMEWQDFLPPAAMLNLLERHFFPKWLQILASWLNQNPNYNEVTNWYRGWKSVIPPDLLATPQVQHQLQQALDMMTRVVSMNSGHPMARQPGATEAMMYLSSTERQSKVNDARIGASSVASSVSEAVKMASQLASTPSSYKELIARRCEERDILFRPIPARLQEGKQVYRCGSLMIYIDRNAIFVQNKEMWVPTSLNTLLDSASN